MRIMLQDYDDNPIIYSVKNCSIEKESYTFYFTTMDNAIYKIVIDKKYGYVDFENIMHSILQDDYYSFYQLLGCKVYAYSNIIKDWIDIKEEI